MSVNVAAVSNQGEFHSRIPRDEPLTTKGHKPGVKVGNDAAPEFHATPVPQGTAPKDRLFTSNAQDEVPGQGLNPSVPSATDTLGGATSADVHTGLGKPIQGETSNELHGSEKKDRNGIEGRGSTQNDPIRERRFDTDMPTGTRGKSGVNRGEWPGAEERVPESAETVAAERD